MTKIVTLLLLPAFLFSIEATAATPKFNHKGIQKGATSMSCYHDPCSVTRIMSTQITKKKPGYTQLKLKAVNGYRGWDSKKTTWEHEFYTLYINCSLKRPNISSQPNKEGYLLPIGGGKYGVISGADYPDVTLYLQACHNYTGDIDEAGARYGYNVKDQLA